MKLRQIALILHRYAGVMVGILLVIIGLTGSLLVFSEELEHLLYPKLLFVTPQTQQISSQKIVDIAQKLYPNLLPQRITVPQKPNEAYVVMMVSSLSKFTNVYINPYNGEILGSRPWKQTIQGFLIDFHVHLFAGEIGGKVVGISGLLLLLLGITGIILWPGWRKLAAGFKIRWKSPATLVNYDIHKVGGILSAIFLSLIAFTGAAMIFWTQFEGAVYWMTGTKSKLPELTSKVVAGVPAMGIDKILNKAEAALPRAKTFKFYPAKKRSDIFGVSMIFPREKNEFHKSAYIYLDQYTGKVLRVDNSRKATLATRIMNAQYILHVGSYGGLPMRVLYVFIGLAPTVLFITGLALWRRRQWAIARRIEAIRLCQKALKSPQTSYYFWVNEWPWF